MQTWRLWEQCCFQNNYVKKVRMQFLFSYELSEAPLFTLTSVNLGMFHGVIVVMGHLVPETNLAMLSALFLCDKVADKWFLMFFVCLFFSPISSLPPAFFFSPFFPGSHLFSTIRCHTGRALWEIEVSTYRYLFQDKEKFHFFFAII